MKDFHTKKRTEPLTLISVIGPTGIHHEKSSLTGAWIARGREALSGLKPELHSFPIF